MSEEILNERIRKNMKFMPKFIGFSAVGAFMFFVSIPFKGKNSIPLDHLTTLIRKGMGDGQNYWILFLVLFGLFWSFYRKTWNKDKTAVVFTVFKVIGTIFVIMYVFGLGPEFLLTNKNLFPYLFDTVNKSLAVLIPVGGIFLAFLTNYGLMEFIGVLVQPVMKPVWKTPGRSAIDAVSSFVGSYSLALLITDKVYQEGKYTKKEATIIAIGFSSVSTTFMIVVANTLNLMDRWNFYFWTTLVITFIATAVTARIYPISRVPDEYLAGVTPKPEEKVTSHRFKHALADALDTASGSGSLIKNVGSSFLEGLVMCASILSIIMAIGVLGMLLALYTPIFNVIGYVFYPFTWLIRIPDALTAAQALSTSFIDMSLPCVFVAESALPTRYVVGVTCISEIIFLSGMVPCVLSTSISVKMKDLLIVWAERVIISVLLAGMIAYIVF